MAAAFNTAATARKGGQISAGCRSMRDTRTPIPNAGQTNGGWAV